MTMSLLLESLLVLMLFFALGLGLGWLLWGRDEQA